MNQIKNNKVKQAMRSIADVDDEMLKLHKMILQLQRELNIVKRLNTKLTTDFKAVQIENTTLKQRMKTL